MKNFDREACVTSKFSITLVAAVLSPVSVSKDVIRKVTTSQGGTFWTWEMKVIWVIVVRVSWEDRVLYQADDKTQLTG